MMPMQMICEIVNESEFSVARLSLFIENWAVSRLVYRMYACLLRQIDRLHKLWKESARQDTQIDSPLLFTPRAYCNRNSIISYYGRDLNWITKRAKRNTNKKRKENTAAHIHIQKHTPSNCSELMKCRCNCYCPPYQTIAINWFR